MEISSFQRQYRELIDELRAKCNAKRQEGDDETASVFGDAAITLSYRLAHYDSQVERFRSVRQAPEPDDSLELIPQEAIK